MGLARSPLTSQTPIQRSVFSRIYASLRETLETTKNPVPRNRGRISRQFHITVSQVFSPVLSSRAQLQASLQPAPPFEVRAEDVEQADCGLKVQDAVCSRSVLRALQFPASAWEQVEYEP